MNNENYNGWHNFATWKVNLEFGFCDHANNYIGIGEENLAEFLENEVLDVIESEVKENSFAHNYAVSFVSNVNWNEIASHMLEVME